jgi:dTDP-glucose pyrophosphorylase
MAKQPLDNFTLAASASLRDAMRTLETNAAAIALVVDGERRLLGTVTDGDIRRALLRGATLESGVREFMQTRFTSVPPAADRAGVLDLMQARRIQQIPVVDADGKLAGVHLLRELLGGAEHTEWAVIMAGGEGTRLRPLTQHLPKPMIRVAGRPILERLVMHLVGHGVTRIFFAVHYKGEVIEEYFGDGAGLGCHIEYLREPEPLGTGGALSLLPEAPPEPVLVMNGDLVTQADIGRLLEYHRQGGQAATLAVRPYFHVVPFGCVAAHDGRLTGIQEKPCITRLVNAGIYVLDPAVVRRIKPGVPTTAPEILLDCCRRGEEVRILEIEEEWSDVGRPEELQRARGRTAHA